MVEVVGNMHMHTPYSDGVKYHQAIAEAAISAELDFIIVTDHNIWLDGLEQVVANKNGRVLMLLGEEVHDPRRKPQVNHLLIYGAEKECAPFAPDPQNLINTVRDAGGVCFLAHPHDAQIPWVDFDVTGYTGIELWNYMSAWVHELRKVIDFEFDRPVSLLDRVRGLPLARNPQKYVTAPREETLVWWDQRLAEGQRVPVIGNADVHGTLVSVGPIEMELFPYEFCFRAVNTHLLLDEPLTEHVATDKRLIYKAMAQGHGWVGYDMAHPTRGFRFAARGTANGMMGDEVPFTEGIVLEVVVPASAEITLIRHGETVAETEATTLTHRVTEPGAYRVECKIEYEGQKRGWIYSNPIYIS